jgi:cyclophilin family peptidyl-prolyl cis-trans isomerase
MALKALLERDRQIVVPLLESLQEFPSEWLTADYKNAVLKLLAKKDFVITSDVYDLAAKFKWQEFVGPALETLKDTWKEDQYDAILGALRLLAQLGGVQHLAAIEPYLEHPNRFVIEQAVATYKAINGTAPRDVPLNHPKVEADTPTYAETVAAAKKHLVIETNLGSIELVAYGEAPLTYVNFSKLAAKGFFNGLNFHRVVSHFVAQGGDPRGDGWGGAGYLIRDEVSPVSHLRGTVGLATAGKDTGSCQLFFNLDPNMNLDANYTLFARVVSGLDVMDRVEVGTKIIRIYVK